jgi:hypothetical protein
MSSEAASEILRVILFIATSPYKINSNNNPTDKGLGRLYAGARQNESLNSVSAGRSVKLRLLVPVFIERLTLVREQGEL